MEKTMDIRNLEVIREMINEAIEKVNEILGTDLEPIEIPIEWNGRLSRSLGYFESTTDETPIKISLSKKMWVLSIEQQIDTILHEGSHYIALMIYKENCGHDKRWKQIAKIVGANPNPYAKFSEEDKIAYRTTKKYTVTCKCCEAKAYYDRMGKNKINDFNNGAYTCGKCKGDKFTIVKNY